METPEDILQAYKEKQKAKINAEDAQFEQSELKKIAKELHAINQELNALNKILRRK